MLLRTKVVAVAGGPETTTTFGKIIDAENILHEAQDCVECIFLAAGGLGGGLKHESTDPLQRVAIIASKKIDEAVALLDEFRNGSP